MAAVKESRWSTSLSMELPIWAGPPKIALTAAG